MRPCRPGLLLPRRRWVGQSAAWSLPWPPLPRPERPAPARRRHSTRLRGAPGRRLAVDADERCGRVEPTVLEQQRPEVARVEELDAHHRVELPEVAQLAVLLAHQALLERRELDVDLQLGQVEVGREGLHDDAVGVPADGEDVRLVEPFDLVVVEDAGQLRLAGVGEAGASGSTSPASRSAPRAGARRPRSPSAGHGRR